MKIFLIEDSRVDSMIVTRMFESMSDSVQCTHVKTIKDSLEHLQREKFDLILMDLTLPDATELSGFVQIKAIAPVTPIVVMTSLEDDQLVNEALNLGAQDYLRKGNFDSSTLERVMRYAIQRSRFLQLLSEKEAELIQKNHDLNVATDKALNASRAKSNFLANMSHEIRTPMNMIIGMADLLTETKLSDQQRVYVENFRRAGKHLLSLINDILDLSKIEAGEYKLQEAAFDLEELMESVSDIIAMSCHSKKLNYNHYIDPQVKCAVISDPKSLKQILFNLANNALKFTEQGSISLEIYKKRDLDKNLAEIILSIIDTGPGIPKDQQAKVFDNFFQIDDSTTRKFRGTGLGLSIVKQLVHLLGGQILLQSQVGSGSNFSIVLPIKTQSNAITVWPNLMGLNVFIANSWANELQSLVAYLENWQANVETFDKTAGLAEAIAARDLYDLYIIDHAFTDFSGAEVVENLRLARDISSRTIMLLPPIYGENVLAKIANAGITAIATKPLKRKVLAQLIANIIGTANFTSNQVNLQSVVTKVLPSRVLNILVVDDDEDNRYIMDAYLKTTSHKIDFAANGAEAWDKFTANKYDIIFMDIQMPDKDGYAVAKSFREYEKQQHSPQTAIVALTANAFVEQVEKAKVAGFNGYITKPVEKKRILETIDIFIATQDNFSLFDAAKVA